MRAEPRPSSPSGPRGPAGLAPEDELLLLLSRTTLGAETEARALGLLRGDPSWPAILRQGRAHGVLPLVTRTLERAGFPGVPADVRAELETARHLNAALNALFARELVRVLEGLGAAGVPVIPLKGVALSESLYGDPLLRVSSDIDILVPRRAAASALRLLVDLGYQRGPGERPVAAADLGLLLRSNMEYGFVSPAPFSCPVELHWDIAWRWPHDGAAALDLWAEARPRELWGVKAHALSAEWELLYLAVHAARHGWQGLKWLVDVHEVCVRDGLRWDRLTDKATRFGLGEILGITLGACHGLFGTPLPPRVSVRPVPSWLSVFPAAPGASSIWQEALLPARLFRRPSEKVGYLLRLLFVPTLAERRLIRLPAALEGLYYPLRPLRLGGRWGTDMVRAALHVSRAAGDRPVRLAPEDRKELDSFTESSRSSAIERLDRSTDQGQRENA